MARSAPELLKEAGDIARRSDLQLAVLVTTLVIIGLAIGQSYWSAALQQASGFVAAPADRKVDAEAAGRTFSGQNSSCSSDKSNQSIAHCMGIFVAQLKTIETTQVRHEGPRTKEIRLLEQQAARRQFNARAIAAYIDERTSLDLPGGIKLPVARNLAPLAWLLLATATLVFLVERRRLFWSIWSTALQPDPAPDQPEAAIEAHDLPVWLAPAPQNTRRDIERAAGLDQDRRWRAGLTLAVAVCAAAAILAIGFVGASLDYFTAVTDGRPKAVAMAWIMLWATLFATGVNLVLLAIAAGARWPRNLARPPLLNNGRRGFLLASLAGGLLLAAAGSVAYPIRRLLVQPRFRKRTPRIARVGRLPRGFYKNTRSDELHYVMAGGTVGQVDPGLKAENLKPLAGAERRVLRLPEAERAALDLWADGEAGAAVSLILSTVRDGYRAGAAARPYLRLLDLAAGMVLHSGPSGSISAVVDVLAWLVPESATAASPSSVGDPQPPWRHRRRTKPWRGIGGTGGRRSRTPNGGLNAGIPPSLSAGTTRIIQQ